MRTINITQPIIHKPKLDECVIDLDGYTIEKNDGLWYILKKDGELLSDIGFWEVIQVSDFFVVNIDGHWRSLSNQGEILLDDVVIVDTIIDSKSIAQEMKDQFISPNTILPFQINEHSTVFIKENGSPVCETGILEYWKLVDNDADSRYVVKYGWVKDKLFLIDSNGKEHDVGHYLQVDGPKDWHNMDDCTFIKYYSSGLILVKSHGKYGFANIQGEGIPYQYDSVEEVDDSLFLVEVNGYYGLLDNYGKELTPMKYTRIDIQELRLFSNAIVYDNHLSLRGYSYNKDYDLYRMTVIDRDGREIINPHRYKCISRYRYSQELEHPLFVVTSINREMTTYCINENKAVLESYRGEKLDCATWGIVRPSIGEIVPQNYNQFSIMDYLDKQIILCRNGEYSIIYNMDGSIIMGSRADISVYNDYFILDWHRHYSIIDKDLLLITPDSSSIQIKLGSFVCRSYEKHPRGEKDDGLSCIDTMEVISISDDTLFRSINQMKEWIG